MINFLVKNNIISGEFKKNNERIIGKWKNGKPHGNIIHTKYDTLKNVILEYRGPYVESGFVKGKLSDNDKYFYEGDILKIENAYYKNGNGILTYKKINYHCTWEKDVIVNNVSFKIKNRNYTCTVDNRMNPIEGCLYFSEGSTFNGKFNNNILEGILNYNNGDKFIGKLQYNNGYELFIDEFNKNELEIDISLLEGIKTFKEGNIIKISGIFKLFYESCKRNSMVKILYKSGTVYEGSITTYEKTGKFLFLNGNKIIGNFSKNKMRGKIFYKNGCVFEGEFYF